MLKNTKLLKEQLEQKSLEVEALSAQVAAFKEKENAIALALTEAQTTAARLLQDKEEQAKKIMEEAERIKAAVIEEAAQIKNDAEAQAKAIIQEADLYSECQRQQGDKYMADYRSAAEDYLVKLASAAKDAQRHAERFAAFCTAQIPSATDAVHLPAPIHKTKHPAERSPNDPVSNRGGEELGKIEPVAEKDKAQEDGSKIWTVDEVSQSVTDAENNMSDNEKETLDAQLDALLDDALN